ncbi:MAG: hypothetical protein HRU28_03430 [Rhizobiales bacterium]|nr:hypothetical protein [Hyphomicrobiales bacterium]
MFRKLIGMIWYIIGVCGKIVYWIASKFLELILGLSFLIFWSAASAIEQIHPYLDDCEDEFFAFVEGVEHDES